ncbi:MAG: PEGA domain-containing protein [Planctomycetota bacterium]
MCVAAALPGCVERRISITSEPSGALVRLNDVDVGRTPLETNFLYHGEYDVQLELDGYETTMTSRDADAPWWEYPPFDLGAELLPLRLDNVIKWHFDMVPVPESVLEPEVFEDELLDRARELRGQTEAGD